MNLQMFDNVKLAKRTQRFKKVHPTIATSSVVCSFLFILYQWSIKTLLQMKYNNWVRDKTKGYVFDLGVVFDDFSWMSMRALFIVLSTFNDNCSLNACLMLNNKWCETTLRIWKDKNSILGVLEEPFDQNRELARSSGL